MLQGKCIMKSSKYGGLRETTPDVRGNDPVFLSPIAGKFPNRNTISGTVAKQQGFELDRLYLVHWTDRGQDKEFGAVIAWNNLMEITDPMDVIKLTEELGEPEMIQIEQGEAIKNGTYHRKTAPLIGQFRQRVIDKLITPTVQTASQITESTLGEKRQAPQLRES